MIILEQIDFWFYNDLKFVQKPKIIHYFSSDSRFKRHFW